MYFLKEATVNHTFSRTQWMLFFEGGNQGGGSWERPSAYDEEDERAIHNSFMHG
jgi:hypothetical protein